MNFYYVDESYIKYLQKADSKVPNIVYHTNTKFLCGVVLEIHGIKYYAPVSHNIKKDSYCIIIKDPKDEPISSIRFFYMIPIPNDTLISKIDFSKIAQRDKKYASLLIQEYSYCVAHEKDIIMMAEKVYRIGCNRNHFLSKYCCDFRKLEGFSLLWQPEPSNKKEEVVV